MTSVNDVNCSHKEIYCRCCRGPRYTSETSYYKKFKTEQLKDHVKSNKNLVKQFFGERGGGGGRTIFLEAIFRVAIFLGAYFRGGSFRGLFSGDLFSRGHFSGQPALKAIKLLQHF